MSDWRQDGDHEQWERDVAAYALGGLEGPELRQFEEHLADCGRCQEQLETMKGAVQALPEAAPAHAPPPALKQRVMSAVRAEAEQSETPGPKRRTRVGSPAAIRPRWALSGLAAAAAAAVAIALVLGGGSSVHIYTGTVSTAGATASVRQSGSSAQLEVASLPAPPPGRIYEVWLQRAGQPPVPAHALFTTGTGSVTVPGNLRGVRAVLVTAEPRPSGSSKPTRAPIIVVRLA